VKAVRVVVFGMDPDDTAARIDHTVLGPQTGWADVRRALEEAREYGTNACVPPCYVAEAADHAPGVTLVTVVGVTHGQHAAASKRQEAVRAWDGGADELDVVVNVGRLQAGEDDRVREELTELVAAVPVPVKGIVETALPTDEEKRRAATLAADAGVAMLKTPTWFADGGATVADVELLGEYLPVKASGGIRSWGDARAMLDAGAERIGTSSGVAVVDFPGVDVVVRHRQRIGTSSGVAVVEGSPG
jgi:deoxyribose-phosphate aldolase